MTTCVASCELNLEISLFNFIAQVQKVLTVLASKFYTIPIQKVLLVIVLKLGAGFEWKVFLSFPSQSIQDCACFLRLTSKLYDSPATLSVKPRRWIGITMHASGILTTPPGFLFRQLKSLADYQLTSGCFVLFKPFSSVQYNDDGVGISVKENVSENAK